jgi:hypothetical protein
MKIGVFPALGNPFPAPDCLRRVGPAAAQLPLALGRGACVEQRIPRCVARDAASLEARLDAVASKIVIPAGRL